MRSAIILIIALLGATGLHQEQYRKVGAIEFFGSSGLDLQKIKTQLQTKEGDELPEAPDAMLATIEKINDSIKQTTGRAATDVELVCCDIKGQSMIFIGLPGTNVKPLTLNPAPNGDGRLSPAFTSLYEQIMEAWQDAVLKGAGSDQSKGYPLSTHPLLRSHQLEARAIALRNGPLLRRVLVTANDPKQRTAAAYFVGYAKQSRGQIDVLVHASRDVDEGVRNNAVRALGVLAESNPRIADQIPVHGFIDMLNSGSWTDRNKGGYVLEGLTVHRNPKVLGQLRSRALASLLEMARWRSLGHAHSALLLLGRIAGIEERRLTQLIAAGEVEQIINTLNLQTHLSRV
jgi:hypothetical protein